MTQKTANIIAVLAMLSLATGYYLVQYRKSGATMSQSAVATATVTSQPSAEKTAWTPGQIPSGDSLSLITGETASQTATPGEGQLDQPEGMEWFYKRFGSSTWFAEGTFNVKSFTSQEYETLIAAALKGNESATIALKLSILKYLKENPKDAEFKALREKLYSEEFLKTVPLFGYLAEMLPDELLDNKDLVSEVLKKNGAFLKFASERLRADKDVVLEAVANQAYPMEFASDKLKGDRGFAKKVLENDSGGLCYLSEELRSDKRFVEQYLAEDTMRCLSNKLLGDKSYILELVAKMRVPLGLVKDGLRDDKDVVMATLKRSPADYPFASERLQNDPDILPIVRAYLLTSWQIYSDLPKKLRGDREVVKWAVAQNCNLLESATPELKDDKEIVRIAFAKNRRCLQYASERLKKEMENTENHDGEAD